MPSPTAFQRALAITLRLEGGRVNDRDDSGGHTNRGITQRVYDEHRNRQGLDARSVEHITDDELESIYLASYWQPVHGGALSWPASAALFDFAVHSGVGTATRAIQRAVGTAADGVVGPKTIAAVNRDPRGATDDLLAMREGFLRALVARRPKDAKFLRGWLARLAALRLALLADGDGGG